MAKSIFGLFWGDFFRLKVLTFKWFYVLFNNPFGAILGRFLKSIELPPSKMDGNWTSISSPGQLWKYFGAE